MLTQSGKQRILVVAVVRLFCLLISLLFAAGAGLAQNTAFTYQGRLTDGGTAAIGTYDIQFKLFDAAGTQQGSTITYPTVQVTTGVFSVPLDFGANAFSGANRFLEINVRPAGSANPYTTLAPRQPITPTPYAIKSFTATSADSATNATQLGGVAASQYVLNTDSRLSDPRTPTSGASNYIQNTGTQQANSNFNITGDGKAGGTLTGNVVTATTQFNIGSDRVLSTSSGNLFVGSNAGTANAGGISNSYFGTIAGKNNQTGNANSFFGSSAGLQNTSSFNSFFGTSAGENNTTGNGNSFFGYRAGNANLTGINNAFFGSYAGGTGTGSYNAFFGSSAGILTTGIENSFFGANAGYANTSGFNNVFFGANAGHINLTGTNNTLIGFSTDVGSNNLTNATAIGSHAWVSQSNSLVLGAKKGINFATDDTNVGIGTTAPKSRLHVAGGNVFIASPNSLIITSPNGACWFIKVSDAGALSSSATACP